MTVRGSSTNSQHLQFWFCILLNIFGKRIAFPLLQHENELTHPCTAEQKPVCHKSHVGQEMVLPHSHQQGHPSPVQTNPGVPFRECGTMPKSPVEGTTQSSPKHWASSGCFLMKRHFLSSPGGWESTNPALQEQPVPTGGGFSLCLFHPGQVTAQQVLDKQMCIQHTCQETAGGWEGAWPLLEGHFSHQEFVLTSKSKLQAWVAVLAV